MTSQDIQNLIIRLVGDAESYMRMLDDAKKATQQAASDMISSFMEAAKAIADGLGLTEFSTFNKALTESMAVMTLVGDQASRVEQKILDMASEGGRAIDELAKAFYELASIGLDTEQSISSIEAVNKLAIAGVFDMAKATFLMGSSQKALGMFVSDSNKNLENSLRITDALLRVTTLATGRTEDFARALSNNAAAAMKAYNVPLEQGLSAIAALHSQGIIGMKAGSDFARLLNLLTKTSVSHASIQTKWNFKIFENGKMRNIADIIENLEQITKGYDPESVAKIIDKLGFPVLAKRVILPLLGQSQAMRAYQEELKKLQASPGAFTEKQAAKQMEAFSMQVGILKNNLTILAIEIGRFLAPAVVLLARSISSLIKQWSGLDHNTRQATIAIALMTAAIAGIGPVIKIIQVAIPILQTLLLGFTLVMTPLLPLFIALGAVITLFVVACGGIGPAFAQIEEWSIEMWRGIKEGFDSFKEWGAPVFDAMKSAGVAAWKALEIIADEVFTVFAEVFQNLQTNVLYWWKHLTDVLAGGDWQTTITRFFLFIEYMLTYTNDLIEQIGPSFKLVFDIVQTQANIVWTKILLYIEQFKNALIYIWEELLPAGFRWLTNNWPQIVDMLTRGWTEFVWFSSRATQRLFGWIVQQIPSVVGAIILAILNAMMKAQQLMTTTLAQMGMTFWDVLTKGGGTERFIQSLGGVFIKSLTGPNDFNSVIKDILKDASDTWDRLKDKSPKLTPFVMPKFLESNYEVELKRQLEAFELGQKQMIEDLVVEYGRLHQVIKVTFDEFVKIKTNEFLINNIVKGLEEEEKKWLELEFAMMDWKKEVDNGTEGLKHLDDEAKSVNQSIKDINTTAYGTKAAFKQIEDYLNVLEYGGKMYSGGSKGGSYSGGTHINREGARQLRNPNKGVTMNDLPTQGLGYPDTGDRSATMLAKMVDILLDIENNTAGTFGVAGIA